MKINLTEAFQQVKHYFPNEKSIEVKCELSTSTYRPEPTFQWWITAAGYTALHEHFGVALAEVVSASRVKEATSDVVVDTEEVPSEKVAADPTDIAF